MTIKRSRALLGRAIETIWLLAIVLVPLAFGPPGWFAQFDIPKVALVRLFASALTVLWMVDAALGVAVGGVPSTANSVSRAKAWVGAHPPRVTVFSASLLLLVVGLSALISPFNNIALRGFEVGQDSYSLLSTASAMVFFFVVAFRLESEAQMRRVAWAVAAGCVTAAGYAILQAAGLDPLNILDYSSDRRTVGSFGNPTYLGAALLLGLPMVFALGLRYVGSWNSKVVILATGTAAGVVMAGLLLSEARGAWLGAAAGGGVFAFGVWRFLPTAKRRTAGLTVVAAAVWALVLIGAVASLQEGDDGLGTTVDRAGSLGEPASSDLSERVEIWQSSIVLAWERPWFEGEAGPQRIVGGLFGYGPDSFQYVFPLRRETPDIETITFTKDGHNEHIQALVELGSLGLIATFGVTLLPMFVGGWWLLRRSDAYSWRVKLVAAAIVAALAGRLVEQLFGVPRLSDTLLSWVLLGMLVALPRGEREASLVRVGGVDVVRAGFAGLGTSVVAVGLVALVSTQVIAPIRASIDAARANDAIERGDANEAFELTLNAIERAPSVASYRESAVKLLSDTRSVGLMVADAQRITETTVALLEGGVAENPYSVTLNSLLGVERLVLAQRMDSDPTGAIEAFQRTVDLLPSYWQAKRILGVALVRVERYEDAVVVLTEALETTPEALSGEPLLYRARALAALGRTEQAIADLNVARSVTTDEAVLRDIENELEPLKP